MLKRTLDHLYWRKRLSMAKIGKLLGVDAATICKYMKKLNIRSRNLSEASTRYPKSPFSGNIAEKSYLLGLMGDLHARYHRLQVNVSLTTTHPAMIRLFESCFKKYGRVNRYPIRNPEFNYYEWYCYCFLHPSFSFLVTSDKRLDEHMLNNNNIFYQYLSGLIDSEGFIEVSKCKEYIRLLIGISSTNLSLLSEVAEKLRSLGYTVKIRESKRSSKAFKRRRELWDLRIERKSDVLRALLNLRLQHQEKSHWRGLALETAKHVYWNEIADRVMALKKEIEKEVQLCKKEAERMYTMRHPKINKTS